MKETSGKGDLFFGLLLLLCLGSCIADAPRAAMLFDLYRPLASGLCPSYFR